MTKETVPENSHLGTVEVGLHFVISNLDAGACPEIRIAHQSA
jgi:hypothetical protein